MRIMFGGDDDDDNADVDNDERENSREEKYQESLAKPGNQKDIVLRTFEVEVGNPR